MSSYVGLTRCVLRAALDEAVKAQVAAMLGVLRDGLITQKADQAEGGAPTPAVRFGKGLRVLAEGHSLALAEIAKLDLPES